MSEINSLFAGADVALFLKDLAKLIEEDTQTLLL